MQLLHRATDATVEEERMDRIQRFRSRPLTVFASLLPFCEGVWPSFSLSPGVRVMSYWSNDVSLVSLVVPTYTNTLTKTCKLKGSYPTCFSLMCTCKLFLWPTRFLFACMFARLYFTLVLRYVPTWVIVSACVVSGVHPIFSLRLFYCFTMTGWAKVTKLT